MGVFARELGLVSGEVTERNLATAVLGVGSQPAPRLGQVFKFLTSVNKNNESKSLVWLQASSCRLYTLNKYNILKLQ